MLSQFAGFIRIVGEATNSPFGRAIVALCRTYSRRNAKNHSALWQRSTTGDAKVTSTLFTHIRIENLILVFIRLIADSQNCMRELSMWSLNCCVAVCPTPTQWWRILLPLNWLTSTQSIRISIKTLRWCRVYSRPNTFKSHGINVAAAVVKTTLIIGAIIIETHRRRCIIITAMPK